MFENLFVAQRDIECTKAIEAAGHESLLAIAAKIDRGGAFRHQIAKQGGGREGPRLFGHLAAVVKQRDFLAVEAQRNPDFKVKSPIDSTPKEK